MVLLEVIYILVLGVLLLGIPAYLVRSCFRKLRDSGRHFTFGITDFWGAIVGLVPFYLLLASSELSCELVLLSLSLLVWLCTGMLATRTLVIVNSGDRSPSGLESAIAVIVGAAVGLGVFLALGAFAGFGFLWLFEMWGK